MLHSSNARKESQMQFDIGKHLSNHQVRVSADELIQGESVDAQKTKKVQKISEELDKVFRHIDNLKKEEDKEILVRFHTGDDGLKSEAQKKPQPKGLTEDPAEAFLTVHAAGNEKAIVLEGKICYSPFVSTTKDLSAFLSTTLKDGIYGGDINLKHVVLNKAKHITVFQVPKNLCIMPPPKTGDSNTLPEREQEILFNTTNDNLAKYQTFQTDNPLQNAIEPNVNKYRVYLDETQLNKLDNVTKQDRDFNYNTPLTGESLEQLKKIHQGKDELMQIAHEKALNKRQKLQETKITNKISNYNKQTSMPPPQGIPKSKPKLPQKRLEPGGPSGISGPLKKQAKTMIQSVSHYITDSEEVALGEHTSHSGTLPSREPNNKKGKGRT